MSTGKGRSSNTIRKKIGGEVKSECIVSMCDIGIYDLVKKQIKLKFH